MPRIASSTYVPQLVAVSATCGVLAIVAGATHDSRTRIADAEIPVPELTAISEPVRVSEVAAVKQSAPPPAPSNQLLYVFHVGGETYAKLSDDEPKHGKRKLVEGEDGTSTVAEVALADLPRAFAGWADKTFVVDGGCTAKVKGFALVTRMVGDPGYAGIDAEKWTTSTAASAGTAQLAARLDVTGCGNALYARDASLAPINTLETIERPELVAAARSALLASEVAAEAQTAWEMDGQNSGPWIDQAEVTTFTRRHPGTGAVYVGMHASIQQGCGGPDVNVWGLFRVGKDGKLVTVQARKLESIYAVERILDVDNDGTLELLGRDWLGLSLVLTRADGEEISRLPMQFHGCPC